MVGCGWIVGCGVGVEGCGVGVEGKGCTEGCGAVDGSGEGPLQC